MIRNGSWLASWDSWLDGSGLPSPQLSFTGQSITISVLVAENFGVVDLLYAGLDPSVLAGPSGPVSLPPGNPAGGIAFDFTDGAAGIGVVADNYGTVNAAYQYSGSLGPGPGMPRIDNSAAGRAGQAAGGQPSFTAVFAGPVIGSSILGENFATVTAGYLAGASAPGPAPARISAGLSVTGMDVAAIDFRSAMAGSTVVAENLGRVVVGYAAPSDFWDAAASGPGRPQGVSGATAVFDRPVSASTIVGVNAGAVEIHFASQPVSPSLPQGGNALPSFADLLAAADSAGLVAGRLIVGVNLGTVSFVSDAAGGQAGFRFAEQPGLAYAKVTIGGLGDNALTAGNGNEVLVGGGGDDTIVGGPGHDLLAGGSGADSFVFLSPLDGQDVIADFTSGLDQIDISAAAFGLPTLPGPLPLSLGALHGTGPQFVYGGRGDLSWYAGGAGGKMVEIASLAGHPSLGAADLHVIA